MKERNERKNPFRSLKETKKEKKACEVKRNPQE